MIMIFGVLAINEWVVLKKFRCLLCKRGVGTGVGGIDLEGTGRRFQDCAVCQCCKQKYV
jgi:hypothetical protein